MSSSAAIQGVEAQPRLEHGGELDPEQTGPGDRDTRAGMRGSRDRLAILGAGREHELLVPHAPAHRGDHGPLLAMDLLHPLLGVERDAGPRVPLPRAQLEGVEALPRAEELAQAHAVVRGGLLVAEDEDAAARGNTVV